MVNTRLLDGRLKLRHLTLVLAIADRGSIVSAAEALTITQPVVTRALREVEGITQVTLFDRGPRGVTPTAFGDLFIEHARAVVAQLREAERQIDQLVLGELGTVTVGTHLAGSNLLLPRGIASLKSEHPQVTIIVREASPDSLQHDVLAGECDLIVGRLTSRTTSGLVQRMMYREPIRLVARKGHPAHEVASPSLAQLINYPWILPIEQTALRAELESAFANEGLQLPTNRIDCTSILTLRELLVSTDCIGVLPLLITREDDRLGLLETPLKAVSRAVGVTYSSVRPLSPAAKVLIRHLHEEAGHLNLERA